MYIIMINNHQYLKSEQENILHADTVTFIVVPNGAAFGYTPPLALFGRIEISYWRVAVFGA